MQVFELKGELRTDLGKKATKVLREEKKFLVYCMVERRIFIFLL